MRRGEATKERVTRTALELFVEKGVRETTIRDIAAAAGVAEGTLYRHYTSKDALAEALFRENYERMAAKLLAIRQSSPDFRSALDGMIRFFCRSFDDDWVLFSYLLLSQHRYLRQRTAGEPSAYEALKAAIELAMERREIPRRDPDLAASMVLGLVLQPAVSKVYGRLDGDLSAHAAELSGACCTVLAMPALRARDEALELD